MVGSGRTLSLLLREIAFRFQDAVTDPNFVKSFETLQQCLKTWATKNAAAHGHNELQVLETLLTPARKKIYDTALRIDRAETRRKAEREENISMYFPSHFEGEADSK